MKARKYVLNFSSQFVMNLISQAIGIFTLPYAGRMLGPSKFGEFNLAVSIAGYVGIVASFGFLQYASREMPRMEDVRPLVNPVRTLKLLLGVVATAIMIGIGLVLGVSTDFKWLCAIAGLNIMLTAFDMRNVFIAKDQMWRVSWLGIIGSICYGILLYAIVHSPDDVVMYGICWTVNVMVPVAISLVLYRRQFGPVELTLKYDKWPELRRESIPLGLSSITATINAYFASVVIGIYLSTVELGYYSAGFRLVQIYLTLFNLVGAVVVPSISRLFVKDRAELLRFLQLFFAASVVIGLGAAASLWLLSDWIVTLLFGVEYLPAIPLVKIWALCTLPLTPLAIVFAGSLIPCNASKSYFYASLTGAVVTLTSIPLLILWLGLPGVPFASSVSELVITLVGAYFLSKKLELSAEEKLQLVNIPSALRSLVTILRSKGVSGYGKDN